MEVIDRTGKPTKLKKGEATMMTVESIYEIDASSYVVEVEEPKVRCRLQPQCIGVC